MALPALPSVAPPSMPSLRVDRALQDMWRGYMQSYQSGDKKAAVQQLEKAGENGNMLALWKLGRMYADGDGVPRDDYKAFQLFSRIVRDDEGPESMFAGVTSNAFVELSLYWLDGISGSPIRPNRAQAMRLLNHAASQYGHAGAQYHLARLMLEGQPAPAEVRLATRWLNNAAEKGHVLAQATLGRMMVMGEHMPRQTVRGLMWLQIARDRGDAGRDRWLMEMYDKAFSAASESERMSARAHAERFTQATERR